MASEVKGGCYEVAGCRNGFVGNRNCCLRVRWHSRLCQLELLSTCLGQRYIKGVDAAAAASCDFARITVLLCPSRGIRMPFLRLHRMSCCVG